MPEYSSIGRPLPRLDGLDKATGKEVYGVDFFLPDMLYGKLLRSPYPHARIISIDTSEALKMEGVMAVITYADTSSTGLFGVSLDRPLFPRSKVHFIGEPVAAVAAVDEDTAEKAMGAIQVNYEELPPVFDVEKALRADAPLVHEESAPLPVIATDGSPSVSPPLTQRESLNRMIRRFPGTNIAMRLDFNKGDIIKGFAESDFTFEDTFRCAQLYQAYLEPHASVASFDSSGKVTIWTNNARAFPIADDITRVFNIPRENIFVSATSIGGSFGGKNWLALEPYCVALSRRAGKPVKLALDYDEDMATASGSVPPIIKMKTGVKKDGTLVAKQAELLWDSGAYGDGLQTLRIGLNASLGPYRVPNARIDSCLVYTNKLPTNPFRSFGAQYAAWANECQMDIIAHRLNIDPLEIRRKNILVDGDLSTSGDVVKGAHLGECLQQVAESIGWGRDPGKNRGIGIACFIKGSPISTLSEARVSINRDGTVDVFNGNSDVGQGLKTVLAQIVSEELSVAPESVRVTTSDTRSTPFDDGPYGSRSTVTAGNAARMAAIDAKQQLLKIASSILEKPEGELFMREGQVYVKGTPARLPLSRVLKEGVQEPITGRGSSRNLASGAQERVPVSVNHFGATAAEVEVDAKTGMVRVIKVATAHDTGQAINRLSLAGQMDGGIVMGLGAALMEEKIFERGRLLNANLRDYKIPGMPDIPQITAIMVESKDGSGPYGARGTGEETNIGITPAIGNAIYNAVGVRMKDIPITPDRLLSEIQRKR